MVSYSYHFLEGIYRSSVLPVIPWLYHMCNEVIFRGYRSISPVFIK